MIFWVANTLKIRSKGAIYMVEEEIAKLREKLNQAITDGKDYSIIYNISVELDELIARYYKENPDINN